MAQIVNFFPGAAHIVAKPQKYKHNRLDKSEEPGDGEAEGGGEGVAVGKEEEGGGVKQRQKAKDHPLL